MLVFGIAGASVIALSIYLPAFLLYSYPQIITVLVTLLLFEERIYYQLSFGIFVYLIMITLFTLNLNRNWLKAIDLQIQNNSLIEQLNEEVEQREAVISERTQALSDNNEALIREIAEREKIKQELLQSEQRLSSIFSTSPAGMALYDKDFNYLIINQAMADMHGRSVEDHAGKSIYDVLPESHHLISPLFEQILQTKEPILDFEISGEVGARPGEISHFTVAYFPILDNSGEAISIGAFVLDITDRKKMEVALHESEERFGLAMRGANDGLFDWDLVNNTIYYSPRWKEMLGYQDHELPNDFSVWEDLVDATDREKSWDMLTDYINGNRDNFHLEFKMRHKDGHWVDILSRAFLGA